VKKRLLLLITLAVCAYSQELESYGVKLGVNLSGISGPDASEMTSYFDEGKFPHFDSLYTVEADPQSAFGFSGGLYFCWEFTDEFLMQVEANYIWKGAHYTKKLTIEESYRKNIELYGTNPEKLSIVEQGLANGTDRIEILESLAASDSKTLVGGSLKYSITNAYLDVPLIAKYKVLKELALYAGPQLSYALHNSFEYHLKDTWEKLSVTGEKVALNTYDYGYVGGLDYKFNDQISLDLRWSDNFGNVLATDSKPKFSHWAFQIMAGFNFSDF
jgi:hypothetical protein